MIEGLVRHDTGCVSRRTNFVDSHGQSTVAFAFCHLLGAVRLMPRLKRIKHERLYSAGKRNSGALSESRWHFRRKCCNFTGTP